MENHAQEHLRCESGRVDIVEPTLLKHSVGRKAVMHGVGFGVCISPV